MMSQRETEGGGGRGREGGRENTCVCASTPMWPRPRRRGRRHEREKHEVGYEKVWLSTDIARGLGAGGVEGCGGEYGKLWLSTSPVTTGNKLLLLLLPMAPEASAQGG